MFFFCYAHIHLIGLRIYSLVTVLSSLDLSSIKETVWNMASGNTQHIFSVSLISGPEGSSVPYECPLTPPAPPHPCTHTYPNAFSSGVRTPVNFTGLWVTEQTALVPFFICITRTIIFLSFLFLVTS